MFDQTPVQERHAALGVFAAIGLSAFGAFYLLITGGFAPILPERGQAAPTSEPAYVRVIDSEWAPPLTGRVTPTSYVAGDTYVSDYPVEPLAGGADEALTDRTAERSYDDISRDIEALYQETSAYRQTDLGEAVYASDTPDADGFVYATEAKQNGAANHDDGSASPW